MTYFTEMEVKILGVTGIVLTIIGMSLGTYMAFHVAYDAIAICDVPIINYTISSIAFGGFISAGSLLILKAIVWAFILYKRPNGIIRHYPH